MIEIVCIYVAIPSGNATWKPDSFSFLLFFFFYYFATFATSGRIMGPRIPCDDGRVYARSSRQFASVNKQKLFANIYLAEQEFMVAGTEKVWKRRWHTQVERKNAPRPKQKISIFNHLAPSMERGNSKFYYAWWCFRNVLILMTREEELVTMGLWLW